VDTNKKFLVKILYNP